ncbi:MAG: ribonuclease H-like domain-containing protein [Planctomycetes bacterium]|nr:ribonuclease H-like domain-containing protein [Planctomycetota bacterium]
MGALRDRLLQFGGVVRAAAPEAAASDSAAIRNLLLKRDARRATGGRERAAAVPQCALPDDLMELEGPSGAFCARDEATAATPPGNVDIFDPANLVYFAKDERLSKLQLSSAVFLDTETTSLSGGAGVLVFMIGIGKLAGDGSFHLRQFFLTSPSRERAMLAAVADELGRHASAITFFGKVFDRHRLEDKFKIHGIPSQFPADVHADLYHITRARFGWKLSDVRLRTVESSLLNIQRIDDLPGSEAPRAYFDYLAKRPSMLARVFEHNATDVRSLVNLLFRCAAPLDEKSDPREQLSAAKGAFALKRRAECAKFLKFTENDSRIALAALRLEADNTKKTSGAAAARPILYKLSELGCCESTLELARSLAREKGGRGEVKRLLELADLQSNGVPAGAGRDRVRAAICALKVKLSNAESEM